MLLMWGALLGAAVGFAHKSHLGVDYLVGKLDSPSRRVVALYVHLMTLLFGGVMAWGGWEVVAGTLATNQISPALGLRMGYVYLAVPISGFFILLFAAEGFLEEWARGPEES
jgi:TRAP-type C4-dicarboxylate transport system permease small subunit